MDELGPLGANLSGQNGESRRVCELLDHPGWLFKEYQSPRGPADTDRLARLVNLPSAMTAAERDVVDRSTAWPSASVLNQLRRTIGVVIPKAPDEYFVRLHNLNGSGRRRPCEVDLLALPEAQMVVRGLPKLDTFDRAAVCSSMTEIAALLEKHEIVYLDWSYANAFWSGSSKTAYLIDLDGASFGPRQLIQSTGFEDPLFSYGSRAGGEVDRYRVALLTARCLTGRRQLPDLQLGLILIRRHIRDGDLAETLARTLLATEAHERATIADLHHKLELVTTANIRPIRVGPIPTNSTNPSPTGGLNGWKTINRPITPKPPVPPPRPSPATSIPAARRAGKPSAAQPKPAPPTRPVPPRPTPPTPPVPPTPPSAPPAAPPEEFGWPAAVFGLMLFAGFVALLVFGVVELFKFLF
ncbi:hypothetical protein ACIA58_23435 [Kribbella sp. NPDC051586]|uniref:hypothetical protein n=1 Tax=Kribbella sp. NPDC051586 TaxID=3364118 RepID=UPI0037A560DA